MGKIAKNYLYNMMYQILVIITPIITAPYLTRVLGAKNLGIYSFVSSSGSIVTTLSLLGIYAYGNRQTAYVRDNREKLTKTFWELEIAHILLGVIGTLFYVVYICFNKEYSLYFLIYYPYILAQFIDCSWIYVGLEDMKPVVMKNFFTKLINVIGIFIFVRTKEDIWIYILMLAVTTLIANITVYSQLLKYIGKPQFDMRNIPEHIKGSISLFLPQVASLFYLQVDKVMLEWLTGTTEQVSFYDQAEKIITIPLTFITVISTVMMPRLANEFKKGNKETIQNLLTKTGKYTLFMACPMMIGLLFIARQFIPWYLGIEYLPTAYAMMILAPIVVLNSLAGLSGSQYFTATNQINILMKAYVSAAVINIVGNVALIPQFGYAGAAISTVLSSLVSVIVQYYYLSKQVIIRGLIKFGVRYGLFSLVMGAILFPTTHKLSSNPTTTLLQILIGFISYTLCLAITKDEILLEIYSILQKKLIKR